MTHEVDQQKWERGAAKLEDVYQGVVPVVPQGFMDFADIMTEDLFGAVWTRDALDVRDRRLIIMGVIAAIGGTSTWKIQCLAGLKRGDFDEEQVREVLIQATPYVGYPRAAEMVGVTEEAINEYKKSLKEEEAPE
ncbi:MAG: 4-carboxymuconolactone decarboxylase [Candidatus Aldehydirespiratoraceae bacterium]|jgi:4-carboxymuconolactone decarboxylase